MEIKILIIIIKKLILRTIPCKIVIFLLGFLKLSIEKTHKNRKLIARYLKLASSSEKIEGHSGGLHVVMSAHADFS